jgi:hypothetical protein
MKSHRPWVLAVTVALLALFTAGCAEEEAEGREAAFPVGVSTPPPAPPAPVAPAAEDEGPGDPESPEVAVGAEDGPGPAPDSADDADPSALTDFHAALDPYGRWSEDPTYGTVWVPSEDAVGPDFTPYETAGRWAYDDDYVWMSDYSWGWAPFHYGRWVYGGPGWEWVPGRAYAGAWVSWRNGAGNWPYVGWAPLPPAWGWRGGVAVGLGFVPVAPYSFVATRELFSPRIAGRVLTGDHARLVGAHTEPWVAGATGGGLTARGRVGAHPVVNGPSPSTLGIAQELVVRPGNNRGIAEARAFAPRPNAALTTSARVASASTSRGRATFPAYGPPAPSHFGGKFGAGFTGSAANLRPSYAPTPNLRPSSGAGAVYYARQGSPAARGMGAAPAYRGSASPARGFTAGPAGGHQGGGGYSGSHGGGGGGSHGGGSSRGHGGGRR